MHVKLSRPWNDQLLTFFQNSWIGPSRSVLVFVINEHIQVFQKKRKENKVDANKNVNIVTDWIVNIYIDAENAKFMLSLVEQSFPLSTSEMQTKM